MLRGALAVTVWGVDETSGTAGAHGNSSDLPRFVSARDFAESSGIPLRSVQRWLVRGLIPGAVRVGPGTKWRIPLHAKMFGTISTDLD